MSEHPTPPANVAAVFSSYPLKAQDRLRELRAQLLALANELEVGPLTETLKWGEPAYLTEVSRAGSTIRLAWSDKAPDVIQALFICTTGLVDTFRQRHGAALTCVGDRAIHVPLSGAFDHAALGECFALALTHKRRKKQSA